MINNEEYNENFAHQVDVIRLEEKKSELEERRMLLLDEIHRTAISGDVDEEACDNIIKEIDGEIQDVESRLEELLIKDLNIDSKYVD